MKTRAVLLDLFCLSLFRSHALLAIICKFGKLKFGIISVGDSNRSVLTWVSLGEIEMIGQSQRIDLGDKGFQS